MVDRVGALNRSVSTPALHSEGAPVTVWMAACGWRRDRVDAGAAGSSPADISRKAKRDRPRGVRGMLTQVLQISQHVDVLPVTAKTGTGTACPRVVTTCCTAVTSQILATWIVRAWLDARNRVLVYSDAQPHSSVILYTLRPVVHIKTRSSVILYT